MENFRPRHTFPLLVGAIMTTGAIMPLINPAAAIRAHGFPDRIALSEPAQACFTIYGARSSAFGAAIWIFFLQGKLAAVDTIMALQGYAGLVDLWVSWKEGATRSSSFGVGMRILVGVWGMLGLTAGGESVV